MCRSSRHSDSMTCIAFGRNQFPSYIVPSEFYEAHRYMGEQPPFSSVVLMRARYRFSKASFFIKTTIRRALKPTKRKPRRKSAFTTGNSVDSCFSPRSGPQSTAT